MDYLEEEEEEERWPPLVNVAATMYLRFIRSIFMALVQFSSEFVEHLEGRRMGGGRGGGVEVGGLVKLT